MKYTRQEIFDKCQEAIADVKTFYQNDIVNYRGKTSDTKEYYTENISQFVCENIKTFQTKIPTITRQTSYKTTSHVGHFSEKSNREEEMIAMKMFNQCKSGEIFDSIGKIIDYQIPLKSVKTDVAGKIDLLSYTGKTVRILELKKADSTETMLRCVLESYTYMKTVDQKKLLSDFGLFDNIEIKASPLVFKDGMQYKEMLEERKWLQQLMKLLDSKAYYIVEENGKYFVTEE